MPDYGHELAFGSFLTPAAADPQRVVDLARASEHAGLDLVTFQDHPYQPAFLDAWTLLTWVAAVTERVQVAGNVLNLPLRPPAVLARSVASLDLLSGGRAALGLGAGAFWDAIEAMGGTRLSPGEAVEALDEAIDVIRGLWDADERGVLRAGGRHHAVDGAKRGPAPAHDVPIWLGAYKPRMLALVGRKADGWLPSLGYLDLADVPAAQERIDEAALAAGRDPREVRRMLNLGGARFSPTSSGFLQGPVDQWVDELLPLVLEHGFSTFVLGSDDERALTVLGEELAPALREAVAAERASAGTAQATPVRSAAALAARSPGIAYDEVPAGLRAVEPGDRGYRAVRSTYLWPGSPGLVLQPADAAEVAAALTFARRQDVPLAVRSGGHGIGGRATNDGGVVVDVSRLSEVRVLDEERGLVRLGAGARWGDVAAALAPHRLAVSSGDMGDVGVGGLVAAGGQGLLGRYAGLTLDRVRAAEVVLTDGTVVRADDELHADLLWAVRGAGANVGVVTAVEVEAVRLDEVVLAVVTYDASDPEQLLTAWAEHVEAAPRELTSFLTLAGAGPRPVGYAMTVWAGDDTQAAVRAIEPMLALAPVLQQQAQQLPYAAVVPAHHARHTGQGAPYARGGLVEHVDERVAAALGDVLRARVAPMVQVRAVGGAVNDVPADATAYAHRTQQFSLLATSDAASATRLDALWAGLDGSVTGVYRSFDTSPGRWALAYPPATMARLREVLAEYDPDRVLAGDLPL